jgi:hypothetical protein
MEVDAVARVAVDEVVVHVQVVLVKAGRVAGTADREQSGEWNCSARQLLLSWTVPAHADVVGVGRGRPRGTA